MCSEENILGLGLVGQFKQQHRASAEKQQRAIKVSVHLTIIIQKVTSNVQSVPPPVSGHVLTR